MVQNFLGKKIEELQIGDFNAKNRADIIKEFSSLDEETSQVIFSRLNEILKAAHIEKFWLEKGRDDTNWAADFYKQIFDQGKYMGALEAVERIAKVAPENKDSRKPAKCHADSRKLMSSILDDFFKDRSDINDKTKNSYRSAVADFEEINSSVVLYDIESEHVQKYADYIRDKKGKGDKPASRPTIIKSLGHIKTVIKWCSNRRITNGNPSDNVFARPKTKQEKHKQRSAFTTDELRKIFYSPMYTGCKSERSRSTSGKYIFKDDRYYFLVVMFLTGARTEELPGATLYTVGDVICLDLRKTGDKNFNAKRLVPIISELRQTGFVKWAQEKINKGQKIFVPLSENDQHSSGDWSKWTNRYIDHVGINDKDKVAYSMRHSFRQMLRASKGLSTELMNKIFGHEEGDAGEQYGSELSEDEARTFLDCEVKPPKDLDLSHLYV